MASKILIENNDADALFIPQLITQAFALATHDSCLLAVTSYRVQKIADKTFKVNLDVNMEHQNLHFQRERIQGTAFRPDILFEVLITNCRAKKTEYDAILSKDAENLPLLLSQLLSHTLLVRYQGFVMEALVKKVISNACKNQTRYALGRTDSIVFENVYYTVSYQDLVEKLDLQVVFHTRSKKHVFKFGVKSSYDGVHIAKLKHKVPQLGIDSFEISDFDIMKGVTALVRSNLRKQVSVIIKSGENALGRFTQKPILVSL